ncbi:glutamate--tRNA ligase [Patescibacteria group bacterium]|nr:glutamate--tRNA ligase [Patescibacteria group bacterium]
MSKVITRFPPSPTGFLHVGSLRTALYNFLFAKANNGKFLLRIEDTDQKRLVKGSDKDIMDRLKLFGLYYDNKPFYQSKRLDIYQKIAHKLVEEGKAYYCFCKPERLENLHQQQKNMKKPTMYDALCSKLNNQQIKEKIDVGRAHVVRLRIPKNETIEFNDLIRGKVKFETNLIDDQIILKSDGFPTYHLASVVDDNEMGITHVMRGEEWLSSTPKHIILYKFLGYKQPEFAHLPLLLNPDRSKLSKRVGDVSVKDYLEKGYLPEALLNFILLLGWNPGDEKEIFSLDEMIKEFDVKKIHKAGAVFNVEKLDWINGHYIRNTKLGDLTKLAKPYYEKANIKADDKFLEKVIATEQERVKRLEELPELTRFFFEDIKYDKKMLVWKKSTADQTKKNLRSLHDFLDKLPENKFTADTLEKEIIDFIKKNDLGTGDVLWPMRVALTGKEKSPGPFEVAGVLGKEKVLERIKNAIKLF